MKIDIVSDVVCPWCIVGYRQLQQALEATGSKAEIHWHPFELNPDMEPEGEPLLEHMMRKYRSSKQDSENNRSHLTSVGTDLGIDFRFDDASRMYNTFDAHQLMHWAEETQNLKSTLKQALFQAYFTEQRDISDRDILIEVAANVGLNKDEARAVLEDQRYAQAVRSDEKLWISRGIQGVPAIIFEEKHLVSGAQGVERFTEIIQRVQSENT